MDFSFSATASKSLFTPSMLEKNSDEESIGSTSLIIILFLLR